MMVTDNATPEILYNCMQLHLQSRYLRRTHSQLIWSCVFHIVRVVVYRDVTRALVAREEGINFHTFVFCPTDFC